MAIGGIAASMMEDRIYRAHLAEKIRRASRMDNLHLHVDPYQEAVWSLDEIAGPTRLEFTEVAPGEEEELAPAVEAIVRRFGGVE